MNCDPTFRYITSQGDPFAHQTKGAPMLDDGLDNFNEQELIEIRKIFRFGAYHNPNQYTRERHHVIADKANTQLKLIGSSEAITMEDLDV